MPSIRHQLRIHVTASELASAGWASPDVDHGAWHAYAAAQNRHQHLGDRSARTSCVVHGHTQPEQSLIRGSDVRIYLRIILFVFFAATALAQQPIHRTRRFVLYRDRVVEGGYEARALSSAALSSTYGRDAAASYNLEVDQRSSRIPGAALFVADIWIACTTSRSKS